MLGARLALLVFLPGCIVPGKADATTLDQLDELNDLGELKSEEEDFLDDAGFFLPFGSPSTSIESELSEFFASTYRPLSRREEPDDSEAKVETVDPSSFITDTEAISHEIEVIDEAIEDIDKAILKSDKADRGSPVATTTAPITNPRPAETVPTSAIPTTFTTPTTTTTEPTEPLTTTTAETKATLGEVSREKLVEFKTMMEAMKKQKAQPMDTRCKFDHDAGDQDAKISDISSFRSWIKRRDIPGSVDDKEGVCARQLKCANSRYRTFDGTCNNLQNPLKGSVNTPFRRILAPAYGDGEFLPRGVQEYTEQGGYASKLPSARTVSDKVMVQGDEKVTESKKNTHMVMQWGQFVDHDITNTAKKSYDCCHPSIRNMPGCFPISVSNEDSFYGEFGRTCLDFTRSSHHCSSEPVAEQYNTNTAFLDGSGVYGDDGGHARKLRSMHEGKLMQNSVLPHFLPSRFDMKESGRACDAPKDLMAGDGRAETQASLTSVHNLFMNEHNRIAGELFKKLKESKVLKTDTELDELVYQETRRIVVAEIQAVTYNEFLPQVIGESAMKQHDLDTENCKYDPETDPSIINSFAAAAYRFGHSLIQSIFRGKNQPWRLGKFFGDARFATKNNGEGYKNELIGLSQQPCQRADVHISNQMTQLLFCNNETRAGGGHDIASINIQRGRDHGIPGFNEFRKLCGLQEIESMSGGSPPDLDRDAWQKLQSVYSDPDDIDLWVGGLAEESAGGMVGPTFACIIGQQFQALMKGDRYFFHHSGGPDIVPFKGKALEELSSRTLADIICESTGVEEMSQNVFVQDSSSNPILGCGKHRKLNLDAFIEQFPLDD